MPLLLKENVGEVKYDKKKLLENINDSGSDLIFEDCLLQRSDVENQNHRIYPHNVLSAEVENYKNLVRELRAYGECDHSDTSVVSLKNTCWIVTELWWNGNELRGNIKILRHTPSGQIVEGIVRDGGTIGISSRALGEVEKDSGGKIDVVQKGLVLVSFDAVAEPSTKSAFMNPPQIKESIDKFILMNENFNKEDLIYRKLNQLYCGKDKCEL